MFNRTCGDASTYSISMKKVAMFDGIQESRFHDDSTAAEIQRHSTLSLKEYFRCKKNAGMKQSCV